MLALAALVRPAFAGYIAAALLLLEVTAGRPLFGVLRSPASALVPFFGAAALMAVATWALLYPGISPLAVLDETVLAPARLMGSGGARYLPPPFLDFTGNLGLAVAWGAAAAAALTAITIAWAILLAPPGGRRPLAVCLLAGGVLPFALALSANPGRDAGLLALALLALAASMAFRFRVELARSPLLRGGAAFGLAGAAFGHYFWERADSAHLVPLLTLALAGGALLLPRLPAAGRLALFGLFFFAGVSGSSVRSEIWNLSPSNAASVLSPFYSPAAKLLKAEVRKKPLPWRCTVFPPDLRDAVAFADGQADPSSRFVAVGSSQAWSSANPIALFLVSSRLPYTRWYQYDPGLQTSPKVQREMERELESSGSRSAVVWKAHHYVFDRARPNPRDRSAFDDFFDRLYPVTAARFGDYDVRLRSPTR